MSLGVIVSIGWLATTAAVTLAMLQRIERRKPQTDWGSPRQLVWLAPAALIIIAAVYVMLTGVWDGRLAIPSKRTPTQYFYLAHQPVAFWLLLAIEFALTALVSALLTATSFLALRSPRRRA